MKFFLLTGTDSLTPLDGFTLYDGEHFSMATYARVPRGLFHVVDENLNAYICMRDDGEDHGSGITGSLVARLALPELRLAKILSNMKRLAGMASVS